MLTLLHQAVLVARSVDHGKKVGGEVVLEVVHHHVHDALGHDVTDVLRDDTKVRLDKIADRLNLPLKLGVD